MTMDEKIDEALRFLLKPGEERVELTRRAMETQTLIPTLDDEVMEELFKRRFICLTPVRDKRKIPIGASVATDGRGGLAIIEVTWAGRTRVAN